MQTHPMVRPSFSVTSILIFTQKDKIWNMKKRWKRDKWNLQDNDPLLLYIFKIKFEKHSQTSI